MLQLSAYHRQNLSILKEESFMSRLSYFLVSSADKLTTGSIALKSLNIGEGVGAQNSLFNRFFR